MGSGGIWWDLEGSGGIWAVISLVKYHDWMPCDEDESRVQCRHGTPHRREHPECPGVRRRLLEQKWAAAQVPVRRPLPEELERRCPICEPMLVVVVRGWREAVGTDALEEPVTQQTVGVQPQQRHPRLPVQPKVRVDVLQEDALKCGCGVRLVQDATAFECATSAPLQLLPNASYRLARQAVAGDSGVPFEPTPKQSRSTTVLSSYMQQCVVLQLCPQISVAER